MGNISESAPAVVQLVIHRLGRKKYRVHVVLPTCQCSRSRRGSRGPAVDAESCIDHSFGIFEKRAPKQWRIAAASPPFGWRLIMVTKDRGMEL